MMITTCIDCVNYEVEYLKQLQDRLTNFLKNTKAYDNCYLNADRKHSNVYYHMIYKADGKRHRKYLGKIDNEQVQILCKRKYAERALQICKDNICLLQTIEKHHKRLDPELIVNSPAKVYRNATELCYDLLDITPRNSWLDGEEDKKKSDGPYKPEGLKHFSADGKGKRSKSEVIIANLLLSIDACFIYESVRWINGKKYHPDFIIYDEKSGKEIIIEYMGMLYNEDYRADALERIENYILAGYTMGRNLLIFMDNEDGNIDTGQIYRLLSSILC